MGVCVLKQRQDVRALQRVGDSFGDCASEFDGGGRIEFVHNNSDQVSLHIEQGAP